MHEVFFRSRFHSETTAHIASVSLDALDDALEERKTDARGVTGVSREEEAILISYENDPNDEPRPEKERDNAMEKMISTAPNRERKI